MAQFAMMDSPSGKALCSEAHALHSDARGQAIVARRLCECLTHHLGSEPTGDHQSVSGFSARAFDLKAEWVPRSYPQPHGARIDVVAAATASLNR